VTAAARRRLATALVLAALAALGWAATHSLPRATPADREQRTPVAAPRPEPTAAGEAAGAAAVPGTGPLDTASLRNVFEFADDAPVSDAERVDQAPVERPIEELEPVAGALPGPRLVGIIHRGGRVLAALVFDGEVELAAAGESTRGAEVLEVGADAVRIRLHDGREATLVPE
jgi:hypothetical protein